jgi:uncharacterized protein YyaL (SSP411 family)
VALIFLSIVTALLFACERRDVYTLSGIDWERDYSKALERSKLTGKPIFIYFSAVWCSWCREYEKELQNTEVRELIEDSFVPLLLDSERERELFLRFEGRGTPFTVISDFRGRVLLKFHGAVRSEDLRDMLIAVLGGMSFVEREKKLLRIERIDADTYRSLLTHFLEDLSSRFDPVNGGFNAPSSEGGVFKWSTPLTYVFLLERGYMREEVLFSLRKDIEFLYDKVDGGFFNFYDRTRAYDFYFETSKTLRVNSLMIIALLKAYEKTENEEFLNTALGTYRYIKRFLYHRESGCFLNAQVSDPSYYNLPPEQRKRSSPPPTDTVIIVEDNAKAILALIDLYRLKAEKHYLREALACVDYILSELRSREGVYGYYDIKSKKKGLLNFGRDLAYLSLALLELSKIEGNYRKELEYVLSLRNHVKDWVSRGVMSYVLTELNSKEGEQFILRTRINLSYHNPDDFVFVLMALENLIERGDR